MAKLYYYHGAMGSSKSATLLMKAYSFEERGIPFICIKPSVDTRDGVDVIKSRAGLSRECIAVDSGDNIAEIYAEIKEKMTVDGKSKLQWILVDECQFLTKKQVNEFVYIVDEFDVNVMCFGLRTDFKGELFEGSKRLMELADNIEEIKISCACGRKAIINARIDEFGNVVFDGEQIQIGGNERYTSMCRKCYFKALRAE